MGEFTETSSFNEGALQIQRLHYLWIEANNHSRSGDVASWRWTLDTIWRELVRDIMRQDKGLSGESFDNALQNNEWVVKYNELVGKVSSALGAKDRYAAVHNVEVFLRVIQDRVGKGGKYHDPAIDDMD